MPESAAETRACFRDGRRSTEIVATRSPGARTFAFDNGEEKRSVAESAGARYVETGSVVLDALFALALEEVRENSIGSIVDSAFRGGRPLDIEAFETGALWHYVWTRDLAYAADLALASVDVDRVITSLMYKTSGLKATVTDRDEKEQILQDTGSGGSYPVSSDRVIWALAANRALHFLPPVAQREWVARVLPIVCATVEQDRRLVHDASLGLYRGEESFLDWREQTYPTRTRENVLPIATSPSLSTNVAHFIILKVAADWTRRDGDEALADRYDAWAEALKAAINERFYDADAGLYAAYLLVDGGPAIRAQRYDLLGQSLAILAGVADDARARRVLAAYPTGPFGPSVVWPQESTVPIYHNHAIWPFVTAYWARAARSAGHEPAVAAGLASLVRGAALHLSNFENLDWGSGEPHGEAHGLAGPVINSRRQLWSVAGFVSVVQDVLFGLETTEHAIRFLPCLPVDAREAFGLAGAMRLSRFDYRGKRIDVTVTIPDDVAVRERLAVAAVTLNGGSIGDRFVAFEQLADENVWEIEMAIASSGRDEPLRTFADFHDARRVFGPPTPAWRSNVGQNGIAMIEGRVTLHYEPVGDRDVTFNVYRDGAIVARGIREAEWADPESDGSRAHAYAIEAAYHESGNASHPTDARSFDPTTTGAHPQRLPRAIPCGREPLTLPLEIAEPGRYRVRVSYSNGYGAINTGITCAIKRATVLSADGCELASDYLICPQTGGPQIFQPSSTIEATFSAPGTYALRIDEDEVCRNMSYFAHNEQYTGHEGGGPDVANEITIDAVRLKWLAAG